MQVTGHVKDLMKMTIGFIKIELVNGGIRGWKVLDTVINKLGYDE